ncbi:MAG: antitoxin [Gammaproteobacteria bacterium]|nr:antitoxin [Gammaproteobacteria bacterium]
MQVLFDDEEYRGIQRVARECRMTVAEWVRQSLREARMARQSVAEAKLRAVDEATRHSFPVGDIETMLLEIEAGRLPE